MSKILLSLAALVVGIVIGAVAALSLGGGAMMGVGVGTGLSSGICVTVEAAQQEGVMTPEQVDQVLARAARNAAGGSLPEGTQIAGSAAQCEEVLAKLRANR